MTEYGRIHTDGSRSGGQPVLKPCPFCGCTNVYPVSPSLGHSSWRVFCDDCHAEGPQIPSCNSDEGEARCQWVWQIRHPAQSDALQAEIEALRHDLERQMTIANEQVNEVERLRQDLRFYAREANYRSMTMYMSGQGGNLAVEIDAGSRAIVALQEQSK